MARRKLTPSAPVGEHLDPIVTTVWQHALAGRSTWWYVMEFCSFYVLDESTRPERKEDRNSIVFLSTLAWAMAQGEHDEEHQL